MNTHTAFAQALFDPALSVPAGLRAWHGGPLARRFAVHRNNTIVSLVDALQAGFPVTQTLVGEDFFRAMAAAYARAKPPRSPVLRQHGQGLPAFIDAFAPAASVPYLADVARLEWRHQQALHAANATGPTPGALSEWLDGVSDPGRTHWRPVPSAHSLASRWAVVSIWCAHQAPGAPDWPAIDPATPESALLFRDADGESVVVWRPPAGTLPLLHALSADAPLDAAIASASVTDPAFDFGTCFAALTHHRLLIPIAESPHR